MLLDLWLRHRRQRLIPAGPHGVLVAMPGQLALVAMRGQVDLVALVGQRADLTLCGQEAWVELIGQPDEPTIL